MGLGMRGDGQLPHRAASCSDYTRWWDLLLDHSSRMRQCAISATLEDNLDSLVAEMSRCQWPWLEFLHLSQISYVASPVVKLAVPRLLRLWVDRIAICQEETFRGLTELRITNLGAVNLNLLVQLITEYTPKLVTLELVGIYARRSRPRQAPLSFPRLRNLALVFAGVSRG